MVEMYHIFDIIPFFSTFINEYYHDHFLLQGDHRQHMKYGEKDVI